MGVAGLVAAPEDLPARPLLRLKVIAAVMSLLFGLLVLRLWTLQVIEARTYVAAARANGIRTVSLPAPRGLIVDRNGTVLVGNAVHQEIVLSRSEAVSRPSIVGRVAALVGEGPAQVQAALQNSRFSPYEPVPVMANAPTATVQYLLDHPAEFPGVTVRQLSQRTYPQGGTTGTHLLGYVGTITSRELSALKNQGYSPSSQTGQTGVESSYESYLRGTDGRQTLAVDAQGQVVSTVHQTVPRPGDTLVLNVDLGLQQAVQSALHNVITADRRTFDPIHGIYPPAPAGAAVVMDVRTGAVLAMASYPTYDLNQWVGGISTANFAAIAATGAENNTAIQGLFTPGSTFKLATATVALQDGVIGPTTLVDDTGLFTVPGCQGQNAGCSFHDASASDAGLVSMPLALTESDDYYFYNLGYQFYRQQAKFGPTPIQNVANQYGLGALTGIDIPGEAQGRIDSQAVRKQLHQLDPSAFPNTTWYAGDNIEMAFGQGGTVVTPIEMADAYATFANGGTRYQPQVAAAVLDPAGRVVKRFAPKVTGHVPLPPSIYQPMLQGFEGAVTSPRGTAYGTFHQDAHFSYQQFPIAGKTGTGSIGNGREPNAWFVGFGPEPDPQYVVVCAVAQAGYGASGAAPAVMNIFNYLEANPVGPVQLPSASHPLSNAPPPTNPPAGTPPSTTTTTAHGASTAGRTSTSTGGG